MNKAYLLLSYFFLLSCNIPDFVIGSEGLRIDEAAIYTLPASSFDFKEASKIIQFVDKYERLLNVIKVDNSRLSSVPKDANNLAASATTISALKVTNEFNLLSGPFLIPKETVGFKDVTIKTLFIGSGELALSFSYVSGSNIEVNVSIPSLLDANNKAFSGKIILAKGTFISDKIKKSYDISGYKLVTKNENITVELETSLKIEKGDNVFGLQIENFFSLNGIKPVLFEGSVGNQTIDLTEQNFNVAGLSGAVDSSVADLSKDDYKITVKIENTYGIPMNVILNSFEVKTNFTNIPIRYFGQGSSPGKSVLFVPSATMKDGKLIPAVIEYEYRDENSNVGDIFANNSVKGMSFKPSIDITDITQLSGAMDFIQYPAMVSVNVSFELPILLKLID